jgi:hypothetical protein
MWRFDVLNINLNSGFVVAGETQTLAAAIDSAMLAQARLCASIIETANMSGLVASRSEFATAVRELNVIQARSNLKETALGCPNGIRPMTGMNPDEILSVDCVE